MVLKMTKKDIDDDYKEYRKKLYKASRMITRYVIEVCKDFIEFPLSLSKGWYYIHAGTNVAECELTLRTTAKYCNRWTPPLVINDVYSTVYYSFKEQRFTYCDIHFTSINGVSYPLMYTDLNNLNYLIFNAVKDESNPLVTQVYKGTLEQIQKFNKSFSKIKLDGTK